MPDRTIGDLFLDGHLFCQTLEDKVREEKVYGQTAIPAGRYEVRGTYSKRFKVVMPQIMNVPGFEGIRIHSGNKPEHTEGCLLVGKEVGDEVHKSRDTFNDFMDVFDEAIRQGKVFITIT